MTGQIRIGVAGWVFPPWRGTFYPAGLKQKDELGYLSRQFRTSEINGTFYSLQRPKSFAEWDAQTPDGFVFSLKAPRFVTHMRRLKDCAAPIANFLASGPLRLGPKLGPILWQLPPNLSFDAERIAAWAALLPHDTPAAAVMAAQHEPRMEGRAWLDPGGARKLRHALEARHPSFASPEALALLRAHDVAAVCTDGVPEWPQIRDATAGFVYCRLHLNADTGGAYDDAALDDWAAWFRAWATGSPPRDVFVYVDAAGDESVKVGTPTHAARLLERLPEARPA